MLLGAFFDVTNPKKVSGVAPGGSHPERSLSGELER
jgi:hypothetical protein